MTVLFRNIAAIGMAVVGAFVIPNAHATVLSSILDTPIIVNNGSVYLDVDNDDFDDFDIHHFTYSDSDNAVSGFVVMNSTYGVANELTGGSYEDNFSLAFTSGNLIDGTLNFDSCGCGVFGAFNAVDIDAGLRTGNYGFWANEMPTPIQPLGLV